MVWKKHAGGEERIRKMVEEPRLRAKFLVMTTMATIILFEVPGWPREDYEAKLQKAVLEADWTKVATAVRERRKSDMRAPVGDWLLGYAGLASHDYRMATTGLVDGTKATELLLSWTESLARRNADSAIAHMLRGRCISAKWKI